MKRPTMSNETCCILWGIGLGWFFGIALAAPHTWPYTIAALLPLGVVVWGPVFGLWLVKGLTVSDKAP